MKLKARQEWQTLEIPLEGGFSLVCREITVADRQRIRRESRSQKFNERTRALDEVVDDELENRKTIDHMVVDIRGLTLEKLEQVAPLEIGSEEELDLPELSDDGTVPYCKSHIVFKDRDGAPLPPKEQADLYFNKNKDLAVWKQMSVMAQMQPLALPPTPARTLPQQESSRSGCRRCSPARSTSSSCGSFSSPSRRI